MTDPNQWSKSFVQQDPAGCVAFLIETNGRIRQLLQQREYPAAIAGIDRVLNGLVTMQNAGLGNFRPHIAVMSSVEGTILAFAELELDGKVASQEDRRKGAIQAFSDAGDFAGGERLQTLSAQMVQLLQSGKSLNEIAIEQCVSLPADAVDGIDTVTEQLQKLLQGAPMPKRRRSGGWIALAVLAFFGMIIYLLLMNQTGEKAPFSRDTQPYISTEATVQETLTQPQAPTQETQVVTEATQSAAAITVNEELLSDMGRTYDELSQKYGPEVDRFGYIGSDCIVFQNSENSYCFSPETGLCFVIYTRVTELFLGSSVPASIAEIENATGITVESEYSEEGFVEQNGNYSHSFSYAGITFSNTSYEEGVFDIDGIQLYRRQNT